MLNVMCKSHQQCYNLSANILKVFNEKETSMACYCISEK
jgi:hypothetical protein